MNRQSLKWGMVKIIGGRHKGRIGLYDDDDGNRAVIYFGLIELCEGSFLVPRKHLIPALTPHLLERRQGITRCLIDYPRRDAMNEERALLLVELALIHNALYSRMSKAKGEKSGQKKVFISHSSKDKLFVKALAVDLANANHKPWLDEWDIRVGQSIATKVSEGISSCGALIVVLSKHATASQWVENEWQAKYWDEVAEGRIMVLPVLLTPCQIPTLLKTKKYADFTSDYDQGFEELLRALEDDSFKSCAETA